MALHRSSGKAKAGCPVSQALKAMPIRLEARVVRSPARGMHARRALRRHLTRGGEVPMLDARPLDAPP